MKKSVCFLILGAALVFSSCGNSESGNQEVDPVMSHEVSLSDKQIEEGGILLGKPSVENFGNDVVLSGTMQVYPGQQSLVTSYYEGNVKAILVNPGDEVKQGQALISIEDPSFVLLQEEFLTTKYALSNTLIEYSRQQELSADNISSKKSFQEVELQKQQQEVKLSALKSQLSLLGINPEQLAPENITSKVVLKAPISGMIAEVYLSLGAHVSAQNPALRIIDTSHPVAVLEAFESQIGEVNVGEEVVLNIQQLVDPVIAKVKSISPVISEGKKSAQVFCELNLPDGKKVLPGSYVKGTFKGSGISSLALPIEALQKEEDQYFVWFRIKNDSNGKSEFMKKYLQIGEKNDAFFQILNPENFDPEADYIVNGGFNL